jgi:hypothetical protein
MSLFFASNVVTPIDIMPGWLLALCCVNLITCEVDPLNARMLADGTSADGLGVDFGVLLVATATW